MFEAQFHHVPASCYTAPYPSPEMAEGSCKAVKALLLTYPLSFHAKKGVAQDKLKCLPGASNAIPVHKDQLNSRVPCDTYSKSS